MESFISIISNLSVIAASWAAIYGVLNWKKERDQFLGERNIELAEEILTLFYEAADVIKQIRNPVGFVGEGETRKTNEHESPDETKILNNAYVAIERYLKHQELFNKIHSLRYRARARFGNKAIVPFDDLNQIINEIIFSSRQLSRYWKDQGRRQMSDIEFQKHLDSMHKAEAIFWEGTEDPDPINSRVKKIIKDIEEISKSIIIKLDRKSSS